MRLTRFTSLPARGLGVGLEPDPGVLDELDAVHFADGLCADDLSRVALLDYASTLQQQGPVGRAEGVGKVVVQSGTNLFFR